MAKKVIEEKKEHSFSLFNSIGGIIGTIITVGTLTFGIGWKIGSWRTENEYENKIRDLQYEKLRLEVEFQNKLQEEKSKWVNEQEQKVRCVWKLLIPEIWKRQKNSRESFRKYSRDRRYIWIQIGRAHV